MTDLTLEALAERVKRLERQSRRQRIVATLVGLLATIVLGALWAGALPLGTLKARRFALVDPDGRARGGMAVSEVVGVPPSPSLYLLDEKSAIKWHLSPARLDFFDANGQRIMMGDAHADSMPGPGLALVDREGNSGATLFLSATGPALAVFDSRHNRRADLTVDEHGNARLRIYDAEGNVLFSAP